MTVSRRFLAKLEAARAALSHSHPGAGAEEILEAGLDLVIERSAKRKGVVARPRSEPRPCRPEHVPAHVKRAVWERDGGRCQWPVDGGGVCGSTHQVELDHVVPRGKDGPSTISNMRLLCRIHNEYAARQVYGDPLILLGDWWRQLWAESLAKARRLDGAAGLLWTFAFFVYFGLLGVSIPFSGLGFLSGAVYGVVVALKHTRSIEKSGEFRTTLRMFGFLVLWIIVVVLVAIYVLPTLRLEALSQMLNFVYAIPPAFYASRIFVYLNWERKNARHILFDSMWVITKVYAAPELRGRQLTG